MVDSDLEIKPHHYSPDYQAMGDCRVCGHGQKVPWHIGEMPREQRIDESLAKQLQRSMELNARMKSRLQKLISILHQADCVTHALRSIINDEEPS